MARKPIIDEQPLTGVYKNGARWWLRSVRAPLSGVTKPLSTGSHDVARANDIKRMVDQMVQNPTSYEWLERAVAGDLTLDAIYTHHCASTLHQLRKQCEQKAAAAVDDDLEPWVQKWIDGHLKLIELRPFTREQYINQVRALIPAGVRFPKSQFTEDHLKETLASLTGARHDKSASLSANAKRRYIAAWKLFFKWAKKATRAGITVDPFEDAGWIPEKGDARTTYYEFDKVQLILDQLEGEDKAAVALLFGSGIELGALLAMKGEDVRNKDERVVRAPAFTTIEGRNEKESKTAGRANRDIFVDAWAWEIFYDYAKSFTPRARLWSYNPTNGGKDLRNRFYRAQVAAGLIEEPAMNEKTRKPLWNTVAPHTLHDCRHSYCINRSLGLDGEPEQNARFCASQLGHADEQMVLQVYTKANVEQRRRQLELQRLRKAATAKPRKAKGA